MPLVNRTKEIILDPQTPATVLLILVMDLFGPDALQWDPETIRMELTETVASKISDATLNKVMAAIELVTTDGFYTDLPTFIRLCNVLYNGTMDLETFDPADVGEIAWGITEAMLIWPPDEQAENPFNHKIVEYIGLALKDEGIMQPPDVLQLGVLPDDTWAKVQASFSDDPTMFSMIHSVEKQKTDEINQTVKHRLAVILQTLDALILDTGDAKDAVRKMFSAINSTEQRSNELRPLNHA